MNKMTSLKVNFLHRSIFRICKFNYKNFFICSMVLLSCTCSGVSTSSVDPLNSEKEKCSTVHLQECMNLLQTINKDHNLAFASTETELKNMCRTMNKGLECVYSHITRCFDPKRQNLINNLLQGTKDVINLLCSPGPFRERYKVHAPCMKNVSTDARMCGPQYEMLIQSVNPKEDVSATDTIRKQCCAFHTYLLCVTEVAESECGQKAANFIKDYSYQTAGPLIKNQCKNYKAGSLMCSLNNSNNAECCTKLTFLLIFLQLLFLCLLSF